MSIFRWASDYSSSFPPYGESWNRKLCSFKIPFALVTSHATSPAHWYSLLHTPSPRFFRCSCLAFPFRCPRLGNSREAAIVDAALVLLHDLQTYSNTGITFDVKIILILVRLLRMLLFQTPVNLPNTAFTLPSLEMMSSSAPPNFTCVSIVANDSLPPLPDKKRSVSSL